MTRLGRALLVLALQPTWVLASSDPECLAVELAFARNDLATLRELQPAAARWRAHRDFRLAAAHIAEGRRPEARVPLNRGLDIVARALRADPQNAELLLTGAMLDGQYLLINRWRFFHNGLRGLRRLGRAEAVAPTNMRVALIRGTAKVLMPSLLGGSVEEAVAIFGSAPVQVPLCESGEWAQIDILTWLGRAYRESGAIEQSDLAFERALALDPDNHWLRRELSGSGYRWEED